MLKQIRFLSRIQLCNLLGLNEIRHTKDKSRRMRYLGLALAWLVVGGMMCAYIVMLSFGLTEMGMGEIVPVYLSAVCSLAILIFTFFKAGSVIFPVHSYEILVSLPVSQTAIVISRFLTMYVSNLLLCLLIMIPGMAVYALKLHPSLGFYLYGIPGMILLPLLPLTLANAVERGAGRDYKRNAHKLCGHYERKSRPDLSAFHLVRRGDNQRKYRCISPVCRGICRYISGSGSCTAALVPSNLHSTACGGTEK